MSSYLITGGSGFLGRGLVRTLLGREASRICIYSRGEFQQSQARTKIYDPINRCRWMIGDVRDDDRLKWAMRGVDVVIHAAALKRIEVGAYAPSEMVLTNVLGTMNVINAAATNKVDRVVYVGTDKAWHPVSPYGHTKATAEALILAAAVERVGPKYAACRYGNVAGSTGSVIPTWREILKKGKTVPVTDPNATRFWMTRDEAVDLVLDTAEQMKGGELNIPNLPAYRLGDLAEAMGAEMRIIGLPKHEKLHEGMCDGNTSDLAPRLSVADLKQRLLHV